MTREEIIEAAKELLNKYAEAKSKDRLIGMTDFDFKIISSLIALVPKEGMVVVPEEPTVEMIEAAYRDMGSGAKACVAYKAMLKAAKE